MVVNGTTLIVRITATMFMPPVVMDVMMMHVSNSAGLRQVGSNILLAFEGMLDMGADQWHNSGDLGQQKEPQEQRTKTPYPSQ